MTIDIIDMLIVIFLEVSLVSTSASLIMYLLSRNTFNYKEDDTT